MRIVTRDRLILVMGMPESQDMTTLNFFSTDDQQKKNSWDRPIIYPSHQDGLPILQRKENNFV